MIYDDTSVNTSVKTVAVASILFDYARAGFEMCERELQLADELACVLEQVACTCTEYAIGIGEFDLVNRIRRSANDTEGLHDSGVHNVAIAFLNADSGAISTQVLDAVDAYDPSKGMNIDSMARDYRAQGWTEEEVQAFLILAKMEHIQYQQQLLASFTDEVLDGMLALADAMEQQGQAELDASIVSPSLTLPEQVYRELTSEFAIVNAHSLRLLALQIRQRQAQLDLALGEQEIALAELTGQPSSVVTEAEARVEAAKLALFGNPESSMPASPEVLPPEEQDAWDEYLSEITGLNEQVDQAYKDFEAAQSQFQETVNRFAQDEDLSNWLNNYEEDVSSIMDIQLDRLEEIRQSWDETGKLSPETDQAFSDATDAIQSFDPGDLQRVLDNMHTAPELADTRIADALMSVLGAPGYSSSPLLGPTSSNGPILTDPRFNIIVERQQLAESLNPGIGDHAEEFAVSLTEMLPIFGPVITFLNVLNYRRIAADPRISNELRWGNQEDLLWGYTGLATAGVGRIPGAARRSADLFVTMTPEETMALRNAMKASGTTSHSERAQMLQAQINEYHRIETFQESMTYLEQGINYVDRGLIGTQLISNLEEAGVDIFIADELPGTASEELDEILGPFSNGPENPGGFNNNVSES